MATTQGTKRHDFWSVAPTNIFDNASFRLNHLMSRDRFDSILKAISNTILPAPDYPDRFHEVREMIEEWNENMQHNFKPGHIYVKTNQCLHGQTCIPVLDSCLFPESLGHSEMNTKQFAVAIQESCLQWK